MERKRKMEKVVSIAMIAVIVSALFGAIAIPASAAEEVTITRTYVQGTEPGTAIVTVNYTVNTAITSLAIKENIPSDWTITEQTSDPTATRYKESTHEWLYMAPPGVGESGMIEYTVSGPPGERGTISGGYNIGAGYVDTPSTEVTLPTVVAPEIKSYTISNRTITLPQTTSIDVEFSEEVEAWIKIEDLNRNLVNLLYHSSGVINPTPKIWDSTYENGTQVPAGDYYVNITGLNTTTGRSVVNNTETIRVVIPPDTIAPTTTVTAPEMPEEPSPIPSGHVLNWTNKTVMLSFHRIDNTGATPSGVNYTAYKIGAEAWKVEPGEEDFTVNVTAEGNTTVLYFSVDKANNSETQKNVTVRIDRTPPSIEFIAPTPANGSTVIVNYVNVTVNVADPGRVSMVILDWNGTSEYMSMIADNTWSVNKTNLPDGTYMYKVYANDTYNNLGASEVRVVTVQALADILDYYRCLDGDCEHVSTTELLTAADDWTTGTAPPGFTEPITTPQLLQLADWWIAGEVS